MKFLFVLGEEATIGLKIGTIYYNLGFKEIKIKDFRWKFYVAVQMTIEPRYLGLVVGIMSIS